MRDLHTDSPPQARRTRSGVHLWDRVAETVITIGGFSVVVAVLGICVYLVGQVVPLFRGGRAEVTRVVGSPPVERPALLMTDEYRRISLALSSGGRLDAVHLPDGAEVCGVSVIPQGRALTATSFEPATGRVALGYDDGTVQLGTLGFEVGPSEPRAVGVGDVALGASVPVPSSSDRPFGAVLERVATDQCRLITPTLVLRAPTEMGRGSGAVRRLDFRARGENEFVVAMREDGTTQLSRVKTIRPLGGGAPRSKLTTYAVPWSSPPGRGLPAHVFVTGDETSILALWEDGLCQRYGCRNPERTPVELLETLPLLDAGRRVTSAAMLLGGLSLIVGDDSGVVTTAFAAVDPSAVTRDSERLMVAHRAATSDAPITSFGISTRDRCLAVGDSAGRVSVRHMTSEKLVVAPVATGLADTAAVAITPKLDGLLAVGSDGRSALLGMTPGYPEVSASSLFGRVHYEGTPAPGYVYQSSSGEDTSEIKLSLVPLIQGTVKATFFAMLFAVPLAVLAAVYTSEFMDKRLRRVVKPAIEMMASLPSVVLGFVAAIIVAPFVRDRLPAVLLAFAVVPAGMMLAGYLWQLIPPWVSVKVRPAAKLALMSLVLAGSLGVAALFGPVMERAMFSPSRADRLVMAGLTEPAAASERPPWVGARATMSPDDERRLRARGLYFRDGRVVRPIEPTTSAHLIALRESDARFEAEPGRIRRWLDGGIGGPWPGWMLVLTVPAAVVVAMVNARAVNRRFHRWAHRFTPVRAAVLDLLKFVGSLAAVGALAAGGASVLSALGADARDVIFGPFSPRNTLVVGLIMGFAVIPIIYTISEDAMSAVPDSLRSASLGAGATPWQTATRIVLPVAASGIFSAVMIGLGRAAGETMIVVMATGNTPSMDWNIFSGFRTLSANIAVELPEAPSGGTHYRVLFLCGLVLFALTFAINTLAEMMRQYFRKRSLAL